jgi:hypothetical protein
MSSIPRRNLLHAVWVSAVLVRFATSARAAAMSAADASAGLRLALEKGTEAAIALLGKPGGFLDDPKVRIPLPGMLDEVAKLARMTGQQKRVDELITAMNRAAELAVPEGRTILIAAAREVSAQDALRIVQGGDTSVTDYFAAKTRVPLTGKFKPIVAQSTEQVSLARKYDALAGKASGFGLLKKKDADLNSYVTGKTLDGLFLVIGEQERKLRKDPMAAGSSLVRQLFGGR